MTAVIPPTDSQPARPLRPQADLERVFRLLDDGRYGDFLQGGALPPAREFMVVNNVADTLAWVLHRPEGTTIALFLTELLAERGAGVRLQELPLGGIDLIARERRRQVDSEGYTPEHDDQHARGELADASMEYTLTASHQVRGWGSHPPTPENPLPWWPWDKESYKPSRSAIRNLVKAGALIAAEIDRLLRAGADLGSAA